MSDKPAERLHELKEQFEILAATGLRDREDIFTVYEEDREAWEGVTERQARLVLDEVLAAQREKEDGFPAVTDCDRLDKAFAALEAEGVLARQDYWCCQTCAGTAITEELETEKKALGFVYFHGQDTESAVEGGGLYLAYGSREPSSAAGVAVGHRIVAALQRAGLKTVWNGELSKRILVELAWQHRMPTS